MRVLDVGCGDGDLSRLLSVLAGRSGEVVAIDSNEGMLEKARRFDASRDAAAIHYQKVDLAQNLPDLGKFDAIVGRRILMYLPDIDRTLSSLISLALPGAIFAFQEHSRAGLPAGISDLPNHTQLYNWVWDTVEAEGGDVTLAFRLRSLMKTHGLADADERSEAILLRPEGPSFLPMLAKFMAPRFIERGIVDANDSDLKNIGERVAQEHRDVGGTIAWDLAFFVSARAV